MIRYSIDGAFDEDGDSLGTTATLLVNNGSDNWVAYSYVVQETAVNITGRESTDVASGGVPSFARGYWNFNLFDLAGATALLSQWSISVESVYQDDDGKNVYENFKRPIIEVSGSGSNYNAIYSFPLYQGTKAQVEAAAAAFLRSKGLSARKLDESPDLPTDRLYYYFKIESGYLDFGTYQGNFSLDRDVNNAILNDLYATIATENDGSLTESEATTILAQVLSNHGVNISTIEKLTVPLNKPALPEGPFYYYDAQWNDISWNYGWKQSESNNSNEAKSDAFYNATDSWWETSYLEKYLISKGVAPTTRYGKMQIKFSNNNTKMTTRNYVSGSGSSMEWDWATLAAARSVNSFDPNEEPITLSR
jgi:hypothetical protein